MAKKDYIPTKDAKLLAWLINYKLKLAVHKAALGITDAEFNSQIGFADLLILAINNNVTQQQEAQGAREGLNNSRKTNVPKIRQFSQLNKNKTSYTTTIGEELGIIGDEDSIDENTAKPLLSAKKTGAGYELIFNLLGHFDAVKIFRTRPGGVKTFLAVDTSSPYLDAEPMVNATIYTAYFMMSDDMVGLESNAITISI